ncbi:hypothetical protein EAH78_26220 [Pseudomonas arsenicoxydans]|uniref:Uncharacterized protein n=1 Tax=Pseudomonas arsenicoxydans TaxID=702115 RepID=A0A502HL77_9PSED|nr:hypothetical protein EAH78_26220 [Pseudomonas arsenicoxydans]
MMVCSGVFIGWYGADVTPRIFYENFIGSMVTIDASNDAPGPRFRRIHASLILLTLVICPFQTIS